LGWRSCRIGSNHSAPKALRHTRVVKILLFAIRNPTAVKNAAIHLFIRVTCVCAGSFLRFSHETMHTLLKNCGSLVAAPGVLAVANAKAQTTWVPANTGSRSWSDSTNWSAAFPNAIAAQADLSTVSGSLSVGLDTTAANSITIGSLKLGVAGATTDVSSGF